MIRGRAQWGRTYLVLLEEMSDTGGEPADSFGLLAHHLLQIDLHIANFDSVLVKVMDGLLVLVGGVQKGL